MQPITITSADRKRFIHEIEDQNLITLYEGRNFTVIRGELERASLARIELLMHCFLENLSLSRQEQYALVKETNALFEEHNYYFHKQPLFSVQILEGPEIHLPAHIIIHSDVFGQMMSEDADTLPTISLPTGFSAEEFEYYLNFFSERQEPSNFEEWSKIRAVADRVLCDQSIFYTIERHHPTGQPTLRGLEQRLSAFKYNIDLTTANGYLSRYLSDYIEMFLHTRTIDEICAELQTIGQGLSKYDIDLTIQNPISGTDLLKLENVIPNVTGLSARITDTPIFPSVWQRTLHTLALFSNTTITIPENTLSNLIILKLTNVKLHDYSVLNNRQKLQTLHLSNINISKVPTGCPSLENFHADNCPIDDFSALDNLLTIKHLHFINLKSIVSVPKGCLSLQYFRARNCPIRDFSGLNDLSNLQNCFFHNLEHLTQFPTGCHRLQMTFITNCAALSDIGGLHNLEHLINYNFYRLTQVTSVPIGCHNLQTITIFSCPLMNDFSGLNNLPYLRSCDLELLPLATRAPQNCPKLTEFKASDCPKLAHFSGLNNLQYLRRCTLYNLPLLTAIPANWPSLISLTVSDCPALTDLSGLRASHKLNYHSVSRTSIDEWKPNYKETYLKSLFPEQKEEDEKTIHAMITFLSEKQNWDPLIELSRHIQNNWKDWYEGKFQDQPNLHRPVPMSPELERYYQSITDGLNTKLTQQEFIDKLNEILNTIRGSNITY